MQLLVIALSLIYEILQSNKVVMCCQTRPEASLGLCSEIILLCVLHHPGIHNVKVIHMTGSTDAIGLLLSVSNGSSFLKLE